VCDDAKVTIDQYFFAHFFQKILYQKWPWPYYKLKANLRSRNPAELSIQKNLHNFELKLWNTRAKALTSPINVIDPGPYILD